LVDSRFPNRARLPSAETRRRPAGPPARRPAGQPARRPAGGPNVGPLHILVLDSTIIYLNIGRLINKIKYN
jgi:hypothetical protein